MLIPGFISGRRSPTTAHAMRAIIVPEITMRMANRSIVTPANVLVPRLRIAVTRWTAVPSTGRCPGTWAADMAHQSCCQSTHAALSGSGRVRSLSAASGHPLSKLCSMPEVVYRDCDASSRVESVNVMHVCPHGRRLWKPRSAAAGTGWVATHAYGLLASAVGRCRLCSNLRRSRCPILISGHVTWMEVVSSESCPVQQSHLSEGV